MKIKYVSTLLLSFLLVACHSSADFSVSLQGEPGSSDWVYFAVLGQQGYLDSVQLQEGKAVWSSDSLSPNEVYVLELKGQDLQDYFLADGGCLSVNLVEDTLGGTPLNDTLSTITRGLSDILANGGSYDHMVLLLENALQFHQDDAVGAIIYYYLDQLAPQEEVTGLFRQAGAHLKQATIVQQMMTAWDRLGQTGVGHRYRDFTVEYAGRSTKLSDFIGGNCKLTVVDFWASWCGPCKQEIPYLIEVYNKYKDQGVQVVGVATWDKPEDTERAIQQLQIPYPQILNAQQIGSDAYGIQGIPEILIIDSSGIIRARGLREEGIEEAVKAVLQEK